jgi:hypothetical protein
METTTSIDVREYASPVVAGAGWRARRSGIAGGTTGRQVASSGRRKSCVPQRGSSRRRAARHPAHPLRASPDLAHLVERFWFVQ